jgi:hypothetical protein
MKKIFVLIIALGTVSMMAATARVDVFGGKEGIKLIPGVKTEGCELRNPGWMKDLTKQKQRINFSSPLLKDKWEEFEFTFTPKKSGKVNLLIRAKWNNAKKKEKPYYVYYKEIKILEGAILKNSNFSKKNEDGTPDDWSFHKKSKILPTFKDEDGATIVKVSMDGPLMQSINVTKDKLIKIKIKVKSAMSNAIKQ